MGADARYHLPESYVWDAIESVFNAALFQLL